MADVTIQQVAQIIEVGSNDAGACEVVLTVGGRSRLALVVPVKVAQACAGKLYDFVTLDITIHEHGQVEPTEPTGDAGPSCECDKP